MLNETFVDRIFEASLKEKVVKLHNDRMTSKQIQDELNISEDWIKEVCAEYDEQLRVENTSEPY